MFQPQQKSTGTRYTTTVALLCVAFIFSPAVLLISRPVGYGTLSLAIAGSAACVVLARIAWKRFSQVTIPSIAIQRAGAK
jgi:hypothetical protein